jgi:hypothetical protein
MFFKPKPMALAVSTLLSAGFTLHAGYRAARGRQGNVYRRRDR